MPKKGDQSKKQLLELPEDAFPDSGDSPVANAAEKATVVRAGYRRGSDEDLSSWARLQ